MFVSISEITQKVHYHIKRKYIYSEVPVQINLPTNDDMIDTQSRNDHEIFLRETFVFIKQKFALLEP